MAPLLEECVSSFFVNCVLVVGLFSVLPTEGWTNPFGRHRCPGKVQVLNVS